MKKFSITLMLFILTGCLDGKYINSVYYSPDKEFSVANPSKIFHPTDSLEQQKDRIIYRVAFDIGSGFPHYTSYWQVYGRYTLTWVPMGKFTEDKSIFIKDAANVIATFKKTLFLNWKNVSYSDPKYLTLNNKSAVSYVVKGVVNNTAAQWNFVFLDYGDKFCEVSHIYPTNHKDFEHIGSEQFKSFIKSIKDLSK